ncbi:MAG: abortive infection family protein [Pseudomonadota bacterium]
MPFVMQQMRSVIERFPDTGDGFLRELEAIESNVETNPHICLGLARGLLESCCGTIELERDGTLSKPAGRTDDLPQRAKKIVDRIILGFEGHPEQDAIEQNLTALAGSLNGAVRALSQLSNVPGLRHGGASAWTGAEKRHAALLAVAVDALSAFLFECHREELFRTDRAPLRYDNEEDFNSSFDDEWPVEIATYSYNASEVLFLLDPDAYKAELAGWKSSQPQQPGGT